MSSQSDPDSKFSYSATDNLIHMEAAMQRYNAWIIEKVIAGYGKHIAVDTRVLDFGAGLGTLSQIFYQKSGVKPDAIEADPEQSRETARRGFSIYPGLPELPSLYDLIYVSNVLEHIDNDTGTLEALKSRLQSEGTLVIYVPAFEFLWTAMDDKVGHLRRYRKKDLADKLSASGYTIDHISYCDSLGFFISILFKFIGNKKGDLPLRSLYIYDRFLLPVSRMMDIFCSRFFGKNLFAVARKPHA